MGTTDKHDILSVALSAPMQGDADEMNARLAEVRGFAFAAAMLCQSLRKAC